MTDLEALEYCRTLLSHFADRLTEWEDTFVRDVRLRLERGGALTARQMDALDRITERCAEQHGRG